MEAGFTRSIIFLTIMYSHKECFCGIRISNESGINNLANKFSNFVLNVGNKYFKHKTFANVVMPRERDSTFFVMDSILRKISKRWIVVTNETFCCDVGNWLYPYDKPVVGYLPDVYIIPVYNNFLVQIKRMEKDDYFNPRAIFILLLLTDRCGILNYEIKHAQIFNIMWSRNALTVNLFILSKCDQNFTTVNGQPFSAESTCRTAEEKGLRYFQEDSKEKEYNRNFVQHEVDSFNGCNFWVGTAPSAPYVIGKRIGTKNETRYEFVGGIDIELLRILSRKLNFTYTFRKLIGNGSDAWYKILPNQKAVGILQDVLEYNADIIFGGIIPNYLTYNQQQYSPSYKFSSLNWYVTDPNVVPQWLTIFRVFNTEVWVLLSLVYLAVCLLYWILEHFRYFGIDTNWEFCVKKINFADFFRIGLGISSTLNPKRVNLRLLFLFWAIYSFHVYTAYTTVLFALISHPPLEKEIKNIYDLKESNMKTGIERIYLMFFEHYEIDITTRSVLDNHFDCPSMEFCLQQLVTHRNLSVMGKKEKVENIISLKRSKVHKITDSMMSYSVSIVTSKGHPVGKGLNKLVCLTLQSGLLNKWESDVRLFDRSQYFEVESEQVQQPLSIEHLQGAFGILLNGLIIAVLVFIGERFFQSF